MALEKHFNKERINVKKLSLEEPEKEPEILTFDPERDITKEDWQNMKDEIDGFRKREDWFFFASKAMEMKTLAPERVSELNLNDNDWQGMKKYLKQCREKNESEWGKWRNFFFVAAGAKILFPERASEINLDDVAWKGSEDLIETNRGMHWWGDILKHAMEVKILAPDKGSELDIIGEREWRLLKMRLERHREVNNWNNFSSIAMRIKIVFPERVSELKLDKAAWQGMRNELKKFREEDNRNGLISRAMSMKVLASEKVKVTDRGIELAMPKEKKPLKEKIPSIPEARKF